MDDLKKIKISVVIPCYNRAKMIDKCINSILKQTIKVHEIIIVDDCSTDNTKEVIDLYGSKVKYVCLTKNSGAQAARNLGIKSATGNWIAFLDSDDEWVEIKIEEQLKFLKKHNYDPYLLIHTGALQVFDDKKIIMSICKISGNNVYKDLLQEPSPMFQGLLVAKQRLVDIGYLDDNVPSYQEWDTVIRLAKICKFEFIDKPLFLYNMHGMATISKNKIRELEGYQYIIDKFKNEIIKYCGTEALNNHLMVLIIKSINYGFKDKAYKYLCKMKNQNFINKLYIRTIITIPSILKIREKSILIVRYIGLYSILKKIRDYMKKR